MIWDLPNLLVCLTLVLLAYLLGLVERKHTIALIIISFVPFFLNNVVFDPTYMPDQLTYFKMLSSIRDSSYNANFYNSRVTEASYLYSLLPLPFVETVSSLGFFNKFLLIIVFIWAASVLKLRGWILWFLICYPSLILYSSLGLRDMLICSFMLFTLWAVMNGWYLLSLILLVILYQIKMQNALVVGLFMMWHIADRHGDFHFTKKKFCALMIALLSIAYFAFPLVIDKVELHRFNMFIEDGGLRVNYQPITDFFDFLWRGSYEIFRALFYPLPWDAKGSLHLLQSIENIMIFALLVHFTWRSYQKIPKQTIAWSIFFLASMLMYGLVVSNVGSLVRYKFPFIVVYFVLLSYEQLRQQQKECVGKAT